MLRGGSWNNNSDNCRVANRNNDNPENRNNNRGFRLAASPSSSRAWSRRRPPLNRGTVLLPAAAGTNSFHRRQGK
ncbi:MAG: hypothetical protein IPK76_21190 [Lewinellaceae bacterium]|nr:hypothetical protein [Lewinellaceae bacterium]